MLVKINLTISKVYSDFLEASIRFTESLIPIKKLLRPCKNPAPKEEPAKK